MAAWVLPAIMGATSVISSIFGGSSAAAAAREREKVLQKMQKENQNWFDKRYNENATQRADAQRILQRTEDAIRKRNRAAAGREAVMGGPTEQTAREKERGNELMADAVGQIVDANEKRKDQIEQQYMNRKMGLQQQEAGIQQERAAATTQAIQGVLGAAGTVAGSLIGSGDGKTIKTTETT